MPYGFNTDKSQFNLSQTHLLTLPEQNIASGDDLNNYTTEGMYKSLNATISASLQNTPITNVGFILLVQKIHGNTISQTVLGYTNGLKFTRVMSTDGQSVIGWCQETFNSRVLNNPTKNGVCGLPTGSYVVQNDPNHVFPTGKLATLYVLSYSPSLKDLDIEIGAHFKLFFYIWWEKLYFTCAFQDSGDGTWTLMPWKRIGEQPTNANNIGTEYDLSSGTSKSIQSFTVKRGINVINAVCSFGANANGHRQLSISKTKDGSPIDRFSIVRIPAVQTNNFLTNIQLSFIYTAEDTEGETLYLNAYQNSGSTLKCNSGVQVLRQIDYYD